MGSCFERCFGKAEHRQGPTADEGVPPHGSDGSDGSDDELEYDGDLFRVQSDTLIRPAPAELDEKEKPAVRSFDIRDAARAAQRRGEPQVSEDAGAPRCMLGSLCSCDQALFTLTIPGETCSYCGARVCAACRTNKVGVDRWWSQAINDFRKAPKGKVELKRGGNTVHPNSLRSCSPGYV